jgi:hypothetical protein
MISSAYKHRDVMSRLSARHVLTHRQRLRTKLQNPRSTLASYQRIEHNPIAVEIEVSLVPRRRHYLVLDLYPIPLFLIMAEKSTFLTLILWSPITLDRVMVKPPRRRS